MSEDVTRRRMLQGLGTAGVLALAGCTAENVEDVEEFDSGVPTEDEDGNMPSYVPLDFVEAERDLEDKRGQFVAVEGWLRYRDNQQWWAFDPEENGGETYTRMLETYDLFPEDPSGYDNPDEDLSSITVVDDGSLHPLPRDAITHRQPYETRIQGEADVLYPDLGYGDGQSGQQHSQQHGEAALKAHGFELLDDDS